jgi:hypothetical protein
MAGHDPNGASAGQLHVHPRHLGAVDVDDLSQHGDRLIERVRQQQ